MLTGALRNLQHRAVEITLFNVLTLRQHSGGWALSQLKSRPLTTTKGRDSSS